MVFKIRLVSQETYLIIEIGVSTMNTNTNTGEQLINAIPVSIYLKNLQSVYITCNQYMLDMAGLRSRDQIIGKTDYELPWSAQADKIREIDQRVMQNSKEFRIEEQPKIYSGRFKTFLTNKSPFNDSQNNIIGIIGVSIDITEQKKLHKMLALTENSLERSSNIREKFLPNISHEIRDPLQGVAVIAEGLSRGWDKFDDTEVELWLTQ